MPIHVVEVRALRLAHKRGEGPGPLCHPVHGNAAKQRLARAFEQRLGFGPLVYKALLLALHERLQAAAVDCLHERSRNLSRNSGGRASSPGGLWLPCRKRYFPLWEFHRRLFSSHIPWCGTVIVPILCNEDMNIVASCLTSNPITKCSSLHSPPINVGSFRKQFGRS